jgi:hypothetical protein
VFRDLKNARDPNQGEDAEDVLATWRQAFLEQYKPVQDFNKKGYATRRLYWSSPEGPWLPIFLYFFESVKNNLSTPGSILGAWSDVRKSQLFNHATLSILEIQFFQFVYDTETYFKTEAEFRKRIDEFTSQRLKREFFTTEWKLEPGRRIEQVNLNRVHKFVRLLWKTNKGAMKSNLEELFKGK